MHTIVIADDHPLFRDAIRLALVNAFGDGAFRLLEAGSVDEVVALAEAESDIDLVLLDLRMPGMEGFAGLIELRNRFPALPLVIVSAAEERQTVLEAMTYGAAGFIPKSLPREAIANALRSVVAGETFLPDHVTTPSDNDVEAEQIRLENARRIASLTPQQLRVLRLVAEGKPNKIIAYELDIGETTVKAHITSILRKLGVFSRTQAVLLAQEHFKEEAISG
ncbi:MAG: response regulator [Geminicoccaceae bacterium]